MANEFAPRLGAAASGGLIMIEPTRIPREYWLDLLRMGTFRFETDWSICSCLPMAELHEAMGEFWRDLSRSWRLPDEADPQILIEYYRLNNKAVSFGYVNGRLLPHSPEDTTFASYPRFGQSGFVTIYPGEFWDGASCLDRADWRAFVRSRLSVMVSSPVSLSQVKQLTSLRVPSGRLIFAEPMAELPGLKLSGYIMNARRPV